MSPTDIEMLAHGGKAWLIGKPADDRVTDLLIKIVGAAHHRADVARDDGCMAKLTERMQRFGEQFFFARENSQDGSHRRFGARCNCLNRHLVEGMCYKQIAGSCEDALARGRCSRGACFHDVGTANRFHDMSYDTKIISCQCQCYEIMGSILQTRPGAHSIARSGEPGAARTTPRQKAQYALEFLYEASLFPPCLVFRARPKRDR